MIGRINDSNQFSLKITIHRSLSDDGNVFVLTTEEREMVEFLRKLGLSECLGSSNYVEESLYNPQNSKCIIT
jgi:hypothetical protein